jgi:capsid protein
MMLHSYEAEYAGQGRGYSSIGEAIQEFENLTDFKSSQIKKAINQSQLWGFNKPSPNAPSSDPLEQFAHQGVGQAPVVAGAPGVGGVNQADSATIIPPTLNVTPIMEASLTVPGSLFLANLDSGEEIVPFVNTAPSIGYSEFVDNFLSYLCAMKGMPLEVLLMKFSNNYSASRACLVLFWRVACMKRQRLDDDLITPTYEMWLSGEIAAGRVSCPGWQDPRLRAAWLCHRLIGSPMPNIDPNATAKADQLYVEMGAETLDDVAYNFNGSSGRANRQKLKTQMDQLRDVGMAAWSTTGVGSPVNTEIDPSKGANGASLDPGVPAQPPAKSAPGGPNK